MSAAPLEGGSNEAAKADESLEEAAEGAPMHKKARVKRHWAADLVPPPGSNNPPIVIYSLHKPPRVISLPENWKEIEDDRWTLASADATSKKAAAQSSAYEPEKRGRDLLERPEAAPPLPRLPLNTPYSSSAGAHRESSR